MSKVIKVTNYIVFYFILIVLLGMLLFTFNIRRRGNQKSILGCTFYNAEISTMAPVIKEGDLVVVREINPMDVNEGDIITYRNKDFQNITIGRVKYIIDAGDIEFVTKGDLSKAEDATVVRSRMLMGKEARIIPYVGKIMNIMQKNIIKVVLLAVVLCSINIFLFSRKRRRELQA